MIADDSTSVVKPRRGPSLIFAVAVIGGVALATAGVVSVFFVQPSAGAPESVIAAEAPIETASLDPSFLPVHKVTVQRIKVKQPSEPQAPPEVAVDHAPKEAAVDQAPVEAAIDVDALAPLDPRWARATTPPPELAASVAATIPSTDASGTPVTALADPTDGTETAAIDPDEAASAQTAKAQEPKADAAVTDDPMSLVKARPTQVTRAANMRSRPKSGSGIIMVVPQSATVQLVGCKVWCEVVYKGRRGYVYKDFLGGGRSASGNGRAKAKVSRADKPKAVKTVDTADTADTADTSEQGLPGVETQTIKPLSTRLQ
jgi:hypothetical protein